MGRSLRQSYNIAAYQYDNQLPEDFVQEVPEEISEEISEEKNLSALDYSFYEHLELLLTEFRSRYKTTWELYLQEINDHNPDFSRLYNEISEYRRGKLFAYRKAVSSIIRIMKTYRGRYGTS